MYKKVTTVDEYIEGSPWKKEIEFLRALFLETELEESIKWNTPYYTLNKKLVAGLAGFKNYVGIWFTNGVFLDDKAGVLINAQEGTTKGLRQWRFESIKKMDEDLIRVYIHEAIENEKAGKRIQVNRKKLVIPAELQLALKNNGALAELFDKFTLGKKKEVANYIGEPKREATRMKRLEKCIPLILEGKTPMDKYRK